jgi:hypothetical protein
LRNIETEKEKRDCTDGKSEGLFHDDLLSRADLLSNGFAGPGSSPITRMMILQTDAGARALDVDKALKIPMK